ncbi:signal peptide protein [Streptomyces sp. NPDC001536]|uniref:signal peptide protein n=1 Tax=Streptomyces sp. NPDC001536 TaxID=3364583 RepID=UPI003695E319
MSLTNYRMAAATLALATALVGVAGAGTAMASTAAAGTAATGDETAAALFPVDFVNLPTRALPASGKSHTFVVSYRNDSSVDQVVAPQILVESPDAGPFLAPADIQVERRNADGSREAVSVASQTGTLFTDLVSAQRTLRPGETLTERYRVSVIAPGAVGTVQPRVALYG